MKAKTFLEIHEALLNKKPLFQAHAHRKGLYNGLCSVWRGDFRLEDDTTFYLLNPLGRDRDKAVNCAWWADEEEGDEGRTYNSTRQNIILLCAAMNGEL